MKMMVISILINYFYYYGINFKKYMLITYYFHIKYFITYRLNKIKYIQEH